MVLKIKIFAAAVLLISSSICYAQHTKEKIELQKMEIVNDELNSILDDIIMNEKKCSYYDCKLIFAITIEKRDDEISLIVESLKDKNIALVLEPYGYFTKDKHLFVIDGVKSNDLFSMSKKKKNFKYVKYDPTYKDPKTGKIIVHTFTDDSFSQWEYTYNNKSFSLRSKISFCN